MKTGASHSIRNGETVARAEILPCRPAEFREQVLQAVEAGARLAALFGHPGAGGAIRLWAVLANDVEG